MNETSPKPKITELLEQLETAVKDTEKVDILNELSDLLLNSEPEKAMKYAAEGLELGERIDYKNGISKCLKKIGAVNRNHSDYQQALEYYRKSLKIDEELGSKNGISICLLNIGSVYNSQGNYEKALKFFRKSLKIAEKLGDKQGIATCLKNIGLVYDDWSDYPKALEYHTKSLEIYEELCDKKGIAGCLHNIGNVRMAQGNYPKALELFQQAMLINNEIGNKQWLCFNFNNIGLVYDYLSDYPQALEYHHKSLKIDEKLGDKMRISYCLKNIGIIHWNRSDYPQALEYYHKSLEIDKELGNKNGISICLLNIGVVYANQGNYAKALEYYHKSLEIREELSDKGGISSCQINIGMLYTGTDEIQKALQYLTEGLNLAKEIGAPDREKEAYEGLSAAYEKMNDHSKALEYYKLFKEINDTIFNEEKSKQIAEMQTKYETEKKEKEAEIYRLKNVELVEANRIIAEEKAKSEKLLLNILPVRVANDLKENGMTEPESFDNATVFFSDIVGFTKLSANLEPKFLIDELSDIFTAFDMIMEKHRCERIKTIGDAYLAVCGLPTENPNHAENVVKAALEIKEYLAKRNKCSEIEWRIRIGIHSGKVVGGIVGIKKYIYDVFGDTINTASRMESNSEPMEINISEATHSIVKDKFNFTERPSHEVKGKGEMKMYFVR